MLRRLVLAWTQVRDVLSSREFWLILALSLLLLTLLSVLLWLAIEQYDTYLRLRSLVCPQGLGNNQLLVIAIVSPLWPLLPWVPWGSSWPRYATGVAGGYGAGTISVCLPA